MMRTFSKQPRNPLDPIATAVEILCGLVGIFIVVSLFLPQQGWGRGSVCTSVSSNSIPLLKAQNQDVAVAGLAHGSQAAIGNVAVCADHPGAALRLAGVLMAAPSLLLLLGALVLARRLLKSAARPADLYSAETADRLRFLGRFLTAGAIIAAIVESAAGTAVLASQINSTSWFEPGQWHLPVSALVVGLVMITLARVMSVGVAMREELDVTV